MFLFNRTRHKTLPASQYTYKTNITKEPEHKFTLTNGWLVLQRGEKEYSPLFHYQSFSIFTPNKTDITNLWSDYCSIWKQISLVCSRSGEWGRLVDRGIIIASSPQQSGLVHLSVSAMRREFLFCHWQLCYAVYRDQLSSSSGKLFSLQI